VILAVLLPLLLGERHAVSWEIYAHWGR